MSKIRTDDPILRDIPMPIRTPRLELRPVMPGDGKITHEAKLETWDMLSQWMIWAKADDPGTFEETEKWARQKYADFIRRDDLTMVGIERATGTPVIWTGLHRIDWRIPCLSIGYWVRKSAQGKGYATESTIALIRYAFEALEAARVEIHHAVGNESSRRVIEKAGFIREHEKKSVHVLPDDTIVDEIGYALFDLEGVPVLDVTWGG